jgi:hypothetical protein
MWQPEQPILLNAWNPACIDAADVVELLLAAAADEVEVEGVEDAAAVGRTEAIATVVDPAVVEAVVDAVVAVAVDAGVVDAVDDVVKGTAGGPNHREFGHHGHHHKRSGEQYLD